MKTKEPPYTERYVRWCGRSANQLMVSLLPYFQIFMSDKIDMVISVALLPVAPLSAPMLVAKKYVLSAVSI